MRKLKSFLNLKLLSGSTIVQADGAGTRTDKERKRIPYHKFVSLINRLEWQAKRESNSCIGSNSALQC